MNLMTDSLPKVPDDHVVEVSLGHVIAALIAMVLTIMGFGLSMILVKEYLRNNRQRRLITATQDIITLITKEGLWKNEKTDTSSPTKK